VDERSKLQIENFEFITISKLVESNNQKKIK